MFHDGSSPLSRPFFTQVLIFLEGNPHTLSDEELVQLIVGQSKTELFGILYDRYADKVYRKCISFSKDEEVAKDMVQDVLLKVFSKLNRFKGNSRFSTWLYAITYNFCVEYYRKDSRFRTQDIDQGPEIAADEETEERELLSWRVDQLKFALDQVAPEDKVLLLLKYQDETPIKEIMDTLEVSESAVKMRLSRARQRVRQVILEREQNELA